MRFASTTIGSPANAPVVTVNQQAGNNFSVGNLSSFGDASHFFEGFLCAIVSQRAYGATIVGTAAAANKAIAEILNPNASGKTLYVYSIDLFVPVAMAVNVLSDGTSLAPVGVPVPLTIGGAASIGKVGGGNQLAPTGSLFYTSPSLTANVDYPIPQPWVIAIPANHNLQLQGQTVNQAFTCNVRWLEV